MRFARWLMVLVVIGGCDVGVAMPPVDAAPDAAPTATSAQATACAR